MWWLWLLSVGISAAFQDNWHRNINQANSTTNDVASLPPATAVVLLTSQVSANVGFSTSTAALSTSAAPSTDTASSTWVQAILDAHNGHRQNASVSALDWGDDLASTAQQIAASCVYEHNT